jgi:hypothetical protein
MLRDDIDGASQDPLQLVPKPAEVQQRPAGLHFHNKIHVTILVRVFAGDGSEQANIARAIPAGDGHDRLAFLACNPLKRHSPAPSGWRPVSGPV